MAMRQHGAGVTATGATAGGALTARPYRLDQSDNIAAGDRGGQPRTPLRNEFRTDFLGAAGALTPTAETVGDVMVGDSCEGQRGLLLGRPSPLPQFQLRIAALRQQRNPFPCR